jgi:hypothetical protein
VIVGTKRTAEGWWITHDGKNVKGPFALEEIHELFLKEEIKVKKKTTKRVKK